MSVADTTAIRAADVASDDQAAPTHPANAKHHWQIPLRAEKKARDATERQ